MQCRQGEGLTFYASSCHIFAPFSTLGAAAWLLFLQHGYQPPAFMGYQGGGRFFQLFRYQGNLTSTLITLGVNRTKWAGISKNLSTSPLILQTYKFQNPDSKSIFAILLQTALKPLLALNKKIFAQWKNTSNPVWVRGVEGKKNESGPARGYPTTSSEVSNSVCEK